MFKEQLRFIDDYADLREDVRRDHLADGMQDTVWSLIAYLHPTGTEDDEYLNAATALPSRWKCASARLACPRHIEYSPQVQPMIQTPGHGHSERPLPQAT